MIRLFNVYFSSRMLFLVVSECLLIALAVVMILWADSAPGFYQTDVLRIALTTAILMLCVHYYDLYDCLSMHKQAEVFVRVIQVLGLTSIIMACLYYAFPSILPGRDSFIIWIVATGAILIVWRRVFLTVIGSHQMTQRTILLGSGAVATPLISELEARPEFGMTVVGYISTPVAAERALDGLPCLGNVAELSEVIQREHVRHAICTTRSAVDQTEVKGISIQDGDNVYEAITGRVCLASLGPAGLMFDNDYRRPELVYKRIASIAFSLLGLILAAPVMALTALLIRLNSRGPVIFRQLRVGQNGKVFTIYKFRSMRVDADGDGPPQPAQKDDSRVTWIGRWLRRTRIDELPQLVNILRGDMDLIGPRPFTPYEEERFVKQIPAYSQRWMVKPGVTGWAQINRPYCSSLEDNREKLSYDLFYIKNLSVGLDYLILFQTVKTFLLGRGAR